MREDIRVSMPPLAEAYVGRESMRPLIAKALEMGEWRLVATHANRMPCAASDLRKPGETVFRAFKLDVLRGGEDGRIAEITTFGSALFGAFGLPDELADVRQS
jgi:hypothetical protein